MDRDEEKDLYIKSKIKDNYIPEKIDNLFNNSAKIINEQGGDYMEENNHQLKKSKKGIIVKRVAAVAACAVIALGGGNIYASTQGYDNVFFMIKEWIAPTQDAYGKDDILSDRDITISYKSIEIAKGIKMQINRLVIKDNEATLHLQIDESESNLDITPFSYIVRDENEKQLCNESTYVTDKKYTQQLKLQGFEKNTKKLNLEVQKNGGETLVKFNIDLINKEIEVIGTEQEIEKISEEELKKYLGAFALLNYENETLNSEKMDKDDLENIRELMVENQIARINNQPEKNDIEIDVEGLCIDVTDIMYSNGIYTVTFTYCYPTTEDINEDRIEDLPVYEMTIGLTINEDQTYSKYSVSSKMEANLIKVGKEISEEDITEITAKCKKSLEKYLLFSGIAEGSPESVLIELDLITYQEFENLRQNEANKEDEYVKTEIKFEEFKNLLTQYMTENLYESRFSRKYKNINGNLAVLDGGATGISFEIINMELKARGNMSYKYEVEYKEDPYEGPNQKMLVSMEYNDGNYIVSKIDYLSNSNDVEDPTVDEELKKFVGEWELDYIMQPGTENTYEFSISSIYGSNNKVTLTINEDGTFSEKITDKETWVEQTVLTGKYVKINENTIKRIYDKHGYTVYTMYEQNKLDETVIFNICKKDQRKYEYYVKEINSIKESVVGNWWRTFNVDHDEYYEFNLRIQSDGTFEESTVQPADENKPSSVTTVGRGTYTIKEDGMFDSIELTYDNGEVHILLYGEKGSVKDDQTKLHYSAGRQVFEKFTLVQ